MKVLTSLLLFILVLTGTPLMAHAATAKPATFEVSGWLPYWRAATSTADVLPHLNKLTEINPFGYTVKTDGELYDAANLNSATSTWAGLIAAARAQHVRVIPTVMWSDTNSIDTVLSSTTLRAAHVANIVATVKANNWDGIDIDYEGKKASDINNFSAFLKQLYAAMGNKWVDCTIEARTPPADLNTNTPLDQFQYANDLTQINKYCDRVRIMTYDQESADKTLNSAAGNSIYSPVADPKWITAVVQLMEKSIAPSKIEMGVATYGYEYNITPYANNSGWIYDLLWSFNPGYATQIENQYHVLATRSLSGEAQLTYTPSAAQTAAESGNTSASATSTAMPTNPSLTAAAANALPGTVRYLTWSDSIAIAQKVALAKKLGIRGIAIFKLDGGEDPNDWNVIP